VITATSITILLAVVAARLVTLVDVELFPAVYIVADES
jgi:hypothetical protein